MLDFTSLLASIGFSLVCLAATLLSAWYNTRSDGFLLTCSVAATLIAFSIIASVFYAVTPQRWIVCTAYVLLISGSSCLYGTAWQFREGRSPLRRIFVVAGVGLALTLPPHMSGYNGLGFAIGLSVETIVMAMTAYTYWTARREAPGTIISLAALFIMLSASFALRAGFVIWDGQWVMDGPPRNWAQDLGLILIISATPGIGVLTIMLNQKRLIRTHRREAMTDPLSGLLNRRALFEQVEDPLIRSRVAILFDIDHFKSINDVHGHSVGDHVIALFAQALRENSQPRQYAARLGGEEFSLIREEGLDAAFRQSEQIRARFSELSLEEANLVCTASAGIAAGPEGTGIDDLLGEADTALYRAKRTGRNRSVIAGSPFTETENRTTGEAI